MNRNFSEGLANQTFLASLNKFSPMLGIHLYPEGLETSWQDMPLLPEDHGAETNQDNRSLVIYRNKQMIARCLFRRSNSSVLLRFEKISQQKSQFLWEEEFSHLGLAIAKIRSSLQEATE